MFFGFARVLFLTTRCWRDVVKRMGTTWWWSLQ